MKNSNEKIGNRTRYLPARSAVPHPTTPPRAPKIFNQVPIAEQVIDCQERRIFVLLSVCECSSISQSGVYKKIKNIFYKILQIIS